MTDCKECERLKADYRLLSESYHELRDQLEQVKAENALLRGDLSKWAAACDESRLGLVLPMPPLVEALRNELDAWQRICGTRQNHIEDVEKLKAENQRLAAKLHDEQAAWDAEITRLQKENRLALAIERDVRAQLAKACELAEQTKVDAEWGRALWDWLRQMLPDAGVCLEFDTEDLMRLAQKHGRAQRVKYDPKVNGELDAEPGSEIWWWGDEPKATVGPTQQAGG